MFLHPVVHVQQGRVGGLCQPEVVDGVRQQQRPGFGHVVLLPALFRIAKHPGDLPAGRIPQQCVALRLDAERLGVGRDELDGPAQVVHGSVVARLPANAIPQNKHRVTLLVQLPGRGHATPQLAAVVERVAREHHGIPGVGGVRREIIQLGVVPAGLGGDLLRRVELIGDLGTRLVVLDQQVQPRRAAGGRAAAHHLFQRLIVVGILEPGQVPLPGVDVGIEAGRLNGGVLADLPHGGLWGDGLLRHSRERQHCGQRQAGKTCAWFHRVHALFQKFAGSYAAVSAALAAVWLSQNATASVIQPSASVPRPGPIL